MRSSPARAPHFALRIDRAAFYCARKRHLSLKMLIARYPLLGSGLPFLISAFCFREKSMKTKNAEKDGKGKTTLLNHKSVPDVIAIEYLRGYLDGLTEARRTLNLRPYDLMTDRMEQITGEINVVEARLK